MKRELKWALGGAGVLAGVVVLGGALVVATGAYDVSALSRHWKPTLWLLDAARERSIEVRLGSISVPDLSGSERFTRGIAHYHEMCRRCHAGPGVKRDEFAEGLYPKPPELAKHPQLDAAEVFWLAKNGLKMTGMPAFGPTHSEEELWDLVAAAVRVVHLTPDAYARLVQANSAPSGQASPEGAH